MTYQLEVIYSEDIKVNFPESLFDKQIETEKNYRECPDSKQQINTVLVVYEFLAKQTNLNKINKLIERKVLK